MGHALSAFVNGEFVGFGHGNNIEKSFVFQKPVLLKPGDNHITTAETVGFLNSGAYMEKRFAGPRGITLQGLMAGTLDVGIFGEKEEIFTEEGAKKVKWDSCVWSSTRPITWYKTYFDAPEGNSPVALKWTKCSKGDVGQWKTPWSLLGIIPLSPLGQPTQSESGNNFNVIVEDLKEGAQLECPEKNQVIKQVEFASYGNPDGACGNLYLGNCTSPNSLKVVQNHCLGKNTCAIPVEREAFDDPTKDPCPNTFKTLAVQAKCALP
ncbi:beta-galactosidase [Datura stramonium]|uniref:Beta-galactosidase n=1 Tax=Datura stramonium TaxID=4076 RepID=A0ABS8VND9_DATST|nr:beta-galactosidase [Datura stramonium]